MRPQALIGMLCAAMFALAGCASSYGESSLWGGFNERRISATVWEVSYFGNGYTTPETVQTYWLHRAAEVTLREGYDGFRIRDAVELTQGQPSAPLASYSTGARFTPVVDEGLDGKPYMVATITLVRAPLPNEPRRVFNARALQAFLGPLVNGEKCGGNVCPHVHRYLFPDFGVEPPASAQAT